MARVLLVALAWCAVRSEEYGGGAMPQYGGAPDYEHAAPAEEYRGHSPDAPAALDYKYEEDSQSETEKPHKYVDDVERWRKPPRNQMRLAQTDAKEDVELQTLDPETDMGLISNRRRSRQRPRGRRERARRDEKPPPRRRTSRFSRTKHDDEAANYLDSIDYTDDNDNFERDDRSFPRETTVRIIRRKVRDRLFAPPPLLQQDILREQIINNEQLDTNRRNNDKTNDLDYSSGVENDDFDVRVRPIQPEPEIARGNSTKLRGTLNHMNYQDYTDYSMRNFNVKSEISPLPRRTTTSRRRAPGRTSPEELVRALWPARRAGAGADPVLPDFTATTNILPVSSAPTIIATRVITTQPTTTTATPTTVASNNATDLSLAEKSRLSILKKAKLKERVKDTGTKKPPVLLKVTNRLPTVVMVEPPTSADPWMRAREVAGDSPEKLDRVKRLMRQKLVAGAKSIHDLTDNWDDTVCDYIDVSMLENAASGFSLSHPSFYVLCLFIQSYLNTSW